MMERKRPLPTLLPIFIATCLLLSLWCGAKAQQQGNGIIEPASGDIVSGVVVVRGTANDPNWLRYELAFRPEFASDNDWIVFAEGSQPVIVGTLAIWDTTVGHNTSSPIFPDGSYRLRLRVVRLDFNYDEYFVTNIIISNDTPTATPTITATETVDGTAVFPTTDPNVTPPAFQQPTALPSLTPFPTPSPQATPVNAPLGADVPPGEQAESGILAQLQQIESGRFRSAFWMGVRWVAILFLLAAIYLLLRWVIRRLWRIIQNR